MTRAAELDHRSLALWVADRAEIVLPRFEEEYPEDDRPRKALEAGRAWARGQISVGEARAAAFAAHGAAGAVTASVAARIAEIVASRPEPGGAHLTGR